MAENEFTENEPRIQEQRAEWTAANLDAHRRGTILEEKRKSTLADYLVIGALLAVVVLIIFWIGSALIDSPTEKAEHAAQEAAEAQANTIITYCANILQPVAWPRMTASEEARMLACSLRQTDDPAVVAQIRAYGMDGR